jgi:hypothetical protein
MLTRRLSCLRLPLIALGIAASACADGDGFGRAESTAVAGTEPLVDWPTFRASVTELPGQGFLAEGDLLFQNEDELHAYWQKYLAGSSGEGLTVRTVVVNGVSVDDIQPFPLRFQLSYCISDGFTSQQLTQLIAALDGAARAWSQIIGVHFERRNVSGTCDQNNTQVWFNVFPTLFTNAPFPSFDRAHRVLNVDAQSPNNDFNSAPQGRDLLGSLTHEFGHILGFQHEHIWNPTCHADDPDTASEKASSRQLTPYDQTSVMNYPITNCTNTPGIGYHISPLDRYGAMRLYGMAPALIGVATASAAVN